MLDCLVTSLQMVFDAMPSFAMAFVLLLAGKVVYDKTTPYSIDDELTEKDNAAFGVCMAGYLVGLGIALCGALFGTGLSLQEDLLTILLGGLASIVLMRLSITVNDRLILSAFSIDKEMIEDRNAGTGAVVAGGSIATGLMLNGVLTGESESVAFVVRDIVVYWLAGQALLVLGAVVFQKMTSYDMHKVIGEDDNVAAGVSFGGFLVALGIVVHAAVAGAGSVLAEELVTACVIGALGLVMLVCARIVADRGLLPGSSLSREVTQDRNLAAGLVAAASFICVALLLSAAVRGSAPPVSGDASLPPVMEEQPAYIGTGGDDI